MTVAALRQLLAATLLVGAVMLSGCATRSAGPIGGRSQIVLLPEGGRPSGVVTVETAGGSQVLDQSWQSVEIDGTRGRPAGPVVLEAAAVKKAFGPVMATMPAPPVHYLLFFQLGSSELLPDSQLLLPEIAKVIKERAPAQLSVVGHADTVGSVEYNYRLGMQRAVAVVELLATQGARPAGVETSSRGKKDLLVKTPDHTLEPRNRRAEVTVR